MFVYKVTKYTLIYFLLQNYLYIFNMIVFLLLLNFFYLEQTETIELCEFKYKKIKFFVFIIICIFCGLPPFLIFFFKVFILKFLFSNSSFLSFFIFLLSNIYLVYFYFYQFKYLCTFISINVKKYRTDTFLLFNIFVAYTIFNMFFFALLII